jgi:AcrR family transcriptional regulator
VSAADRRQQFLDITAELLLTQGPESVTLQRVAKLAEVNHATIYRFFDNRDDLLLALVHQLQDDYDAVLLGSLEDKVRLEDRLRALVPAMLDPDIQRNLAIVGQIAALPARSDELLGWQQRRVTDTIAFLADLLRHEYPSLTEPQAVIVASSLGAAIEGIVVLAGLGTPTEVLVDTFTLICIGAVDAVARGQLPPPLDVAT